jgi:small subunit ribosomal protein S16
VAVKIKLKRMGKIRAPFYRIIVADARTKRDGRAIEEIGKYHPKVDPSLIEVDSDRAQYWLSVGAQPTDPVRKLLEVTGDWQKFKGLPGAEGTLKTAAARPDKKEAFAAAVAETVKDLKVKGGGKAADGKPADGKAGEARADKGKARKPAASADKPRAAKDDAAAKDDVAAKDSAAKGDAKDGTAKDGTAKEGAAKPSAAKETSAKTGTAKAPAAKGAAAKGTTAKSDAEGSAREDAAPAESEPAAATASDAGQDGEA